MTGAPRPESARPLVSVIVPVRDEEAHLDHLLACMRAQEVEGDVEFLLVDGRSRDRSRELVEAAAARDPRIRLLDNPHATTPHALNIGLASARGEYVARMDAHASYPPGYLAAGIERVRRGDVVWAAGPALPRRGRGWSSVVTLALSSPLGVGGSPFRRLPAGEIETDTAFAGVLRAETLRRLGGWDEGWPVNQDAELAARVRAAGGRIVCLPEMAAEVVPRQTLRGLARQYWRYGQYRVKTAVRHPDSLRRSHLLPPGLVVACACAVAAPRPLRAAARLAPALYGTVLLAAAGRLARDGARPADTARLPAALATMHLAWGAGFLAGAARFGPPLRAVSRALSGRRA